MPNHDPRLVSETYGRVAAKFADAFADAFVDELAAKPLDSALLEREPYASEHPSTRGYLLARR